MLLFRFGLQLLFRGKDVSLLDSKLLMDWQGDANKAKLAARVLLFGSFYYCGRFSDRLLLFILFLF